MLLNNYIKFETVDGARVAKDPTTGEILRDAKTKAPLAIKDAVANVFKEKPILMGSVSSGNSGGRGGGNNAGVGGFKGVSTMSQAKESWLSQNPDGNTTSSDFMDYVGSVAKENPQFDFYN